MNMMYITGAGDEYAKALRLGQKEYKEKVSRGQNPHPEVLPDMLAPSIQDIPLTEIPMDRIIGVRSAGRAVAFSAGFMPLQDADSEFASKWISLCAAHLGQAGIRDPIRCYEYLGDFYVEEGNKRVSVMRYFGAASILGHIKRILPVPSDEPRIKAYYEFLDFYKNTSVYDIQFRKPGEYERLLAALGRTPGERWSDSERKAFAARYHSFKDAFYRIKTEKDDQEELRPEDALLMWLKVYPFEDLAVRTPVELADTLDKLWGDLKTAESEKLIHVQPILSQESKTLLGSLIGAAKSHLTVAFVYQRDVESSLWTKAHDQGCQYIQQELGQKVTAKSYFHADTPELADALIEQAVGEGADAVFTTTPALLRPTLKASVQYPKVRFFNCSADIPFSRVRGYYFRAYEGKFITGAIAGAMADNNRIGYIASYPIVGVPASINAFAMGAQMTNPKAKIHVCWSCQAGNHIDNFMEKGIRVISNRDVPTPELEYMKYGEFGTYYVDGGQLIPLGSPVWLWGKFYEQAVRGLLSGSLGTVKSPSEATNYWLGMDSGAVDVALSSKVPEGTLALAELLRRDMKAGNLDPFYRKIIAQDGTLVNDGSHRFTAEELLHMDWLCDNVIGKIPTCSEIQPISRALVRELGVHKERIPPEKEGHR